MADGIDVMLGRLWRSRKIPSRLFRFHRGYRHFEQHGVTPDRAYKAMRQLSVLTNGRFNEWIAARHSRQRPRRPVIAEGVLGNLSDAETRTIADRVREDGFHVFDCKLESDAVDELLRFARQTPARYLLTDVERTSLSSDRVRFDPGNVISPKYQFDKQVMFESDAVARFITDPSLLAVAQEYLNAEPILDLVVMWWSAPFGGRGKSAAAQMYHFDMDRINFIKLFVYLTDVGEDNGPHCFVRGSHRTKPGCLLTDGRKTDEQILAAYSPDDIVEITGERGTIIAVDTRGFHKGKPLLCGERLILQVEFATSMFGAEYPRIRMTPEISKELLIARRDRESVYGPIFEPQ